MQASRELSLPFRVDVNGGIATTRSRDEILVHHVSSVLGTQPTERVMRPGYGCDLQRFAFSLGDPLVLAEMEGVIRNAMASQCPEALFISFTAEPPTEDGVFVVRVKFTDATNPQDNPLESAVQFAVSGDGGEVIEVTNG